MLSGFRRGYRYGRDFHGDGALGEPATPNWLEEYFDNHLTGPGLWKWRHYFPVYDRHFAKFRGHEVHVVEIGIFSGGSLEMWHSYFGDQAHVYGVDIAPECRSYEGPRTRVFIGDQSDPEFWDRFVREVPKIDIIIDDGGHQASQQIPTLEALLPHLRPGGVYLCEDVQGNFHAFHDYVDGLSRNLHAMGPVGENGTVLPTQFQRVIDSVHLYPFITVIERRADALDHLSAPKHGTEWQPFLDIPLPNSDVNDPGDGERLPR
jgi:hypothetical protein